jgi:hypothetical protein
MRTSPSRWKPCASTSVRAATAIVGAIAVASILVALALILPRGGSSGRSSASPVEAANPPKAVAAPAGGLTQCGGDAFSVEGVSCAVGAEIHDAYVEGERGALEGTDPSSGETTTVTCDEGTTPVTCTGPGGLAIYFAP